MTRKCQLILINGGAYFLYFFASNWDPTDLDIGTIQKRNRLIALSFASVLLLLVYGPLAPWFLAADRFLYDTFSSGVPNRPLDNTIIISIDPSRADHEQLLAQYGQVLAVLARSQARRIVLPHPPQLGTDEKLPGWSAALGGPVPVYVPTGHRLAETAPGGTLATQRCRDVAVATPGRRAGQREPPAEPAAVRI
jgi:hypothetical protein